MMKWLLVLAIVYGAWVFLRRKRKRAAVDARLVRDAAEARNILGVSAHDDADAIRAAHRRILADVHPDRGGSTELAGRANAARDLLLSLRQGTT
ncbi:J domain-containing protein [Sphingomonas sp.]|uniref:J domain-containing protein n=1 Tax=Sphingomonas sp. TaxID=28214 RepID=UPI0035BBD3AA